MHWMADKNTLPGQVSIYRKWLKCINIPELKVVVLHHLLNKIMASKLPHFRKKRKSLEKGDAQPEKRRKSVKRSRYLKV